LGECRSNVELFRALAERMGFEEDCWRDSVDEMIDAALDSRNPWLAGISRQRLERKPHVRLNFEKAASAGQPRPSVPPQTEKVPAPFLPFENGNFRTPSGKAEL